MTLTFTPALWAAAMMLLAIGVGIMLFGWFTVSYTDRPQVSTAEVRDD